MYICRVGQNHTFIGIHGVYTVFLAGKSPYIHGVYIRLWPTRFTSFLTCNDAFQDWALAHPDDGDALAIAAESLANLQPW